MVGAGGSAPALVARYSSTLSRLQCFRTCVQPRRRVHMIWYAHQPPNTDVCSDASAVTPKGWCSMHDALSPRCKREAHGWCGETEARTTRVGAWARRRGLKGSRRERLGGDGEGTDVIFDLPRQLNDRDVALGRCLHHTQLSPRGARKQDNQLRTQQVDAASAPTSIRPWC